MGTEEFPSPENRVELTPETFFEQLKKDKILFERLLEATTEDPEEYKKLSDTLSEIDDQIAKFGDLFEE